MMKYTLDYGKYADLARQAVAEGCVLLKNENQALPIREGECVSVFGRIQFTYYKSGTGSGGMVNAPYVTGITDAIKMRPGIRMNQELESVYLDWIKEHPFDMGQGWAQEPWCQEEMPLEEELVKKAAAQSDLALVIIGRTAGEDKDNSAAPGSYLLTDAEKDMLKKVCAAFERVAVVLNVGNIMDMSWADECGPQALLYAWQGGMVGGEGVVDVLTGKENPSGCLSDTIAYSIDDYPSTKNFGDANRNFYQEDIYVGYRYFETFAPEKVKYPFGFGLSYTDFSMEVTSFSVDGLQVKLSVCVRNTGTCAGKKAVQVYVEAPQGLLGKPARSLIRFGKTTLLAPGEAEDLEFALSLEEAASYDDGGLTGNKSCYVLEAGTYVFYVGGDVRSARAAGSAEVEALVVTEKLTEAMAPVLAFERLKPGCKKADGTYEEVYEDAPLRTVDLAGRIAAERPKEAAYTGDLGYRLADVCDGKVTMEAFLSQLSDEDLACLVRGEGMCSPKVTPGIASAFGGVTESLKNFGIPTAGCSDGPSGIRMDCGTSAFSMPNGTLLACTFNLHLTEALFEMEGMELRKNKIDTLLGPGINIHRNPMNGRNFEYFSEDPYLTGKMAAAQLRGMAKYGVTGTIKHFAGNNQEFRRHDADGVVSERALREIYLRTFEHAVKEGGAYSIMSSYGPINGIWTAGNYDLLTTILRGEWKYDGVVMTDWWAKINEEGEEARGNNTIPMVRAQNDVYMVVADSASNSSGDNTMEGIKTGAITRAQLIRNGGNICAFLMRSPVMNRFLDREFDVCDIENDFEETAKNAALLQSIEVGEGCVLDISGLDTGKGKQGSYQLNFAEKGAYTLRFRMRSFSNDFAQMPMSVFFNNQLEKTVTITGTGGAWVERKVTIGVHVSLQGYLKLFFGEGGIEFDEIRIVKN